MPIFFRQNRWIMPLFGAILACFSAIILLFPLLGQKEERLQMSRLKPLTVSSTAVQNGGSAAAAGSAARKAILPGLLGRNSGVSKNLAGLILIPAARAALYKPLSASAWLSADYWTKATGYTAKARTLAGPVALPQTRRTEREKAAAKSGQTAATKAASQQAPPIILYFSRTEILSRDERAQATRTYTVSKEDVLLLQKIVMAEAEGEPYEGKVAVANVVLNRLRSANFPNSIKGVIYQKYQFSPVANGRLDRVRPNQESIKAVSAALSGVKEVSDDTYYFLSLKLAQDLSIHHSRTFFKKIGNHSFYR